MVIVIELFIGVVNKNIPPPFYSDHPYGPDELQVTHFCMSICVCMHTCMHASVSTCDLCMYKCMRLVYTCVVSACIQ